MAVYNSVKQDSDRIIVTPQVPGKFSQEYQNFLKHTESQTSVKRKRVDSEFEISGSNKVQCIETPIKPGQQTVCCSNKSNAISIKLDGKPVQVFKKQTHDKAPIYIQGKSFRPASYIDHTDGKEVKVLIDNKDKKVSTVGIIKLDKHGRRISTVERVSLPKPISQQILPSPSDTTRNHNQATVSAEGISDKLVSVDSSDNLKASEFIDTNISDLVSQIVESDTAFNMGDPKITDANKSTDPKEQLNDSTKQKESKKHQSVSNKQEAKKTQNEAAEKSSNENTKHSDNKGRLSLVSLQAEMNKNKDQICRDMKEGFENVTKSLTDPELGLVPRFNRLEFRIMDKEEGLLTKVENLENRMMDAEGANLDMKASIDNADAWTATMQELTGTIERHEKEIKALKNQAATAAAKSMETEVLIGGISESSRENLKMKVTHFFRTMLDINFENKEVIKVKRVGGRRMVKIDNKMVKTPKLVLAKLTLYLKNKVTKNAYKLAGEKDPRFHYKYFITDNIPEVFREARAKYKKQIDDIKQSNKGKDPKDKTAVRITHGKLYVNNKIVKDEVTPPTAQDILRITPDIQKNLEAVDYLEADEIKDEGNVFKAYAVIASNPEEINTAYVRIKQINAAADHIAVGYTYRSAGGEQIVNGCDDDEHGCATRIVRKIKRSKYTNIAIYIARYYSGVHLGTGRFKHMDNLTDQCLDLINGSQSTDSEKDESVHSSEEETEKPKPQRVRHKKKRKTRSPIPPTDETKDNRDNSEVEDEEYNSVAEG